MTAPLWFGSDASASSTDAQARRPLGIPTTYRGTRFRSRGEARWAAFFDLIDWPWEYEAVDLRGYIPDLICSHDAGDLLVEIKDHTLLDDLRVWFDKIERSGWQKEALLIGAHFWEPRAAQPIWGWIGHGGCGPQGTDWEWYVARLFRCISCGKASPLADDDSWHCRVCGCREGNLGSVENLGELWGAAGARVQWRPER